MSVNSGSSNAHPLVSHGGLADMVCEHFVHDVSKYYRIVPPVAKDCYLNKLRVMNLEKGDGQYDPMVLK